MRRFACIVAFIAGSALVSGQSRPGKTLNIYVVDVEGGNATLLVSPSGQSLLIDTGNLVGAARDADRIMAAARDAGVSQIDHLVTTHWHGDHYGGLSELAGRIPIRHFIDHGPNVQPNPAVDEFLKTTHPQLYGRSTHTVAKAGDQIAMTGLDVRVVSSAGQVIAAPRPGAGSSNPYCATFKLIEGNAEDPQSVVVDITFGRFRALHPGDLTRNKEFELMCPRTRIAPIDVFLGMHNGQDTSTSKALVTPLNPRVAIITNGTRKGGGPEVLKSSTPHQVSKICGRCTSPC